MTDTFDCLVVGAGPAGSAAALALARENRRPLLLDASPFPRTKTCGGGLNPLALRALDLDLSHVLGPEVSRVRFTWCGGEAVEAALPENARLSMVCRESFDAALVQSAIGAGATFRDQSPVQELCLRGTEWVATTPSGDVKAPYLILAEGSKGRMAAKLGLRIRRHLIPAMEAEPVGSMDTHDILHMDFGLVPGGYAWAFPKPLGWNIGAGSFHQRDGLKLRTASQDMAKLLGIESPMRLVGHPIALWDGPSQVVGDRVLVAGEAAALVDPFTAEGIRPAVLSGLEAGKAVSQALTIGEDALWQYQAFIRDQDKDFAWARRLAAFFYRFPQLAFRHGVQRPGATDHVARLFAGQTRYRDLAPKALRRLASPFLP